MAYFPIVGIGSSAGGLEALQKLFSAMPPDSGLGFIVAAHLDPDILVVDEVLAVGDMAFQKKCLAKMDSSTRQEGRTIVFVSHNMQAVRSLCTRALLLKEGRLVADGPVTDVLKRYSYEQTNSLDMRDRAMTNRLNRTRNHARIENVDMSAPNAKDRQGWSFFSGEAMELKVAYGIDKPVKSLALFVSFTAATTGEVVTNIRHAVRTDDIAVGERGEIVLLVPKLPLRPGDYALTIALADKEFSIFEDVVDANVSLPHLTVESAENEPMTSDGWFAIDYAARHAELPPAVKSDPVGVA